MNAAESQGSEPCLLGGRKLYEMATLQFFNRGGKTAFLKSKLLYYFASVFNNLTKSVMI